jgi:hypothetical protein
VTFNSARVQYKCREKRYQKVTAVSTLEAF